MSQNDALWRIARIARSASCLADQDKSPELARVCAVLHSTERALFELIEEKNQSRMSTAGMCQLLSICLVEQMRRANLDAGVLAGWIGIGPKDWLEHEVCLVRFPNKWMTIDYAVSQLQVFAGLVAVIVEALPGERQLSEALSHEYNWWTPADSSGLSKESQAPLMPIGPRDRLMPVA